MLNLIDIFIKELQSESVATRKMLERIPTDKMDWAPHAKSMNMKDLATHIADLPSWISLAINTDELDFMVSPYNPRQCNNAEELVAYYDECMNKAIKDLEGCSQEELSKPWSLRNGDQLFFTIPKHESIRHAYQQTSHHRAQLGVYLRLLDIALPAVYGPSADEQF